MTVLETRQAANNPSIPMTIYKKVINNIWHKFVKNSHHTTLPRKSSKSRNYCWKLTITWSTAAKTSQSGKEKLKKTSVRMSHIWPSVSTSQLETS
jgi:hypothetical protein